MAPPHPSAHLLSSQSARPAKQSRDALALWLLAALVIECSALALLLQAGRTHLWLILPVHALVTAMMVSHVVGVRKRGDDTTMPMLAMLSVAAIGPAGAAGVLLISRLDRQATQGPLLAAWYERIALSVAVDPVTRFCDDVGSGRMIDLKAPSPPSYATVMALGSLADRQAALGNIARRFHPDYLAVLSQALNSPEPVIRVQAAAVAAHVRPQIAKLYREAVESIPEKSLDAADALDLLATFEKLIGSGLLDEGDRRHGIEIAARLGDIVMTTVSLGKAVLPRTASAEILRPLETTFERLLIARGRFAEFRSHRSAVQALSSRPRAKIRRLVMPAVARSRV